MSLLERVRWSSILSQQEKLLLAILSNESMTPKALMECLMSEPYQLTRDEVLGALTNLNKRELLEIHSFSVSANHFDIEAKITFAIDWILKV